MPKAHNGTLNDQLLAVNERWWSAGNHGIHGINKPTADGQSKIIRGSDADRTPATGY